MAARVQLTSVEPVKPRIFGVVLPTLELVLGLVGLIGRIAILGSGQVATGIVLAVLARSWEPSRSIWPAAGRLALCRGSR